MCSVLPDNSIAQMHRLNVEPVLYIDKDDYLAMTGIKKPKRTFFDVIHNVAFKT